LNNQTEILNTEMGTRPNPNQFVSSNFYKTFPKYPVNVGFSIRSSDPDYNAVAGETYFLLARK